MCPRKGIIVRTRGFLYAGVILLVCIGASASGRLARSQTMGGETDTISLTAPIDIRVFRNAFLAIGLDQRVRTLRGFGPCSRLEFAKSAELPTGEVQYVLSLEFPTSSRTRVFDGIYTHDPDDGPPRLPPDTFVVTQTVLPRGAARVPDRPAVENELAWDFLAYVLERRSKVFLKEVGHQPLVGLRVSDFEDTSGVTYVALDLNRRDGSTVRYAAEVLAPSGFGPLETR